jgi:hypothetical protein
MASGYIFACTHCAFTFEAWDDGNPYILDGDGVKQHVYHPDLRRDLAVGNDVPHLCLDCGTLTDIDSEKPRTTCRRCRSTRIIDCCNADASPCPKCKQGTLQRSDDEMIS